MVRSHSSGCEVKNLHYYTKQSNEMYCALHSGGHVRNIHFVFQTYACLWVLSVHGDILLVRSFDVEMGDHPVQWLLDNWNDGMVTPMCCWLDSISSPGSFCPEWSTTMMPVIWLQLSVNLFIVGV